jgi:hypothetical protein
MNARSQFEGLLASHFQRPGIFCDFSALREISPEDGSCTVDTLLVCYLNEQHSAGTPVVIISSAPEEAQKFVNTVGLDPALCDVKARQDHYCCVLDTLIDPCPSLKLKAVRHWKPDNQVFLAMIREFLNPTAVMSRPSFPIPGITI